ncbi:hypothetical protein BGY98DRAFT_960141 [Russula aff. rugulosa BPL654]|nr:hypothetical protein BGY98DRAFT_960141 [Russula aff. rugulosa BPL654]
MTLVIFTPPQYHPPIILYGPPVHSAVMGHVVTIFGCTGFFNYLVSLSLAHM